MRVSKWRKKRAARLNIPLLSHSYLQSTMRKPTTIEKLYLDFDGFFASVMQQAMPSLRGKPVGVIPFETSAANSTIVMACSKEVKAKGCKNVMTVRAARNICPELVLVTQRPDLYRRAHNALLTEISCEIPIETVKSIDELCCKLDSKDISDPAKLAQRIKARISKNICATVNGANGRKCPVCRMIWPVLKPSALFGRLP